MSCRLIAPVAHRIYVQWPEVGSSGLEGAIRGQRSSSPANDPDHGRSHRTSRSIASSRLRTAWPPEARRSSPSAARRGFDRERAVYFDYLPFVELQEWISKARVVVCHAGIGSVALCLSTGRHPVVVPRLKRLSEYIDDHQLTFGRRLAELGLATLIEDVSDLAEAVRSAPTRQRRTGLSPQLADELLAYIGSHAAAGDRPPRDVGDREQLEP